MTGTVKIKFTETKVVDDHRIGTDQEQRFEAGRTYEMSPRSADRWVKRGVAEFASEGDRAAAQGASSDVSLNLSDRDRLDDAKVSNAAATGTSTSTSSAVSDDEKDLTKLKADELKALAADRKVDIAGLTKKDDIIGAIERDAALKASLAAGNFDDLTVAELQKVAAEQNIDLTGKTAKADVVEAVKAGYKPA